MRKYLVLVNYMRTNPTIVDDLIKYLSNEFEHIYVVNRNTKDAYQNIKCFDNVSVLEVSAFMRPFYYVGSLFSFFRKESFEDIIFALKNRRFNISFIKRYYKYLTIGNMLYGTLKKIKCIKSTPDEVSLMSIWFTYEAYAIARIKKKYPALNCVSMAHAHEIESFDNKYTFVLKKYQHLYLDNVAFISNTKMQTYFHHVCMPLNIDTSKCVVKYWGSKYIDFNILPKERENKIIVTCSTVEPLKRVDSIAKAISLLNFDYEWYHFGDGSSTEELLSFVGSFDEEIKRKIHIMGRLPNDEIKKFYTIYRPDLFINFSTTEGLPISVMEALSYSIPAIVTDVGGEREIVSDGINGYVIPRETSVEQLATCISRFLSLPDAQLTKMKIEAKKQWSRLFNLDKNINDYLELLKK